MGHKKKEKISIYTVKFSKDEVYFKKHSKFSSVLLKRGIQLGKPSEPAIPWKKVYFSVPWNSLPLRAECKKMDTTLINKDILVEPVQPRLPTLVGTEFTKIPPNEGIYNSDDPFPEDIIKIIAIRKLGGFALLELEICPFQYFPKSRSLNIVQKMNVEITIEIKGPRLKKDITPMSKFYLNHFSNRVKSIVVNPLDVLTNTYAEVYPELYSPWNVIKPADYVIITSNDLFESFQKLAEWKTSLGLVTRVVKIENILGNTVPYTNQAVFNLTGGYIDGGTRDTEEAIRNFIKWASENWLIQYVLLGGDTEIIPCRYGLQSWVGIALYRDRNDPADEMWGNQAVSSEKVGSEGSNVTDNDINTFWECDDADPDPTITFTVSWRDYGIPINSVSLIWGDLFATSYKIQISLDQINWMDFHIELNGQGGTEDLQFQCNSCKYVRLKIESGTDFKLASMELYRPSNDKYGGTAYDFGTHTTRIYLSIQIDFNSTNDVKKELIFCYDGPHEGEIIPYNENSDDHNLGWHFVKDFINGGLVQEAVDSKTPFIEIRGPPDYHGHSFLIKSSYNYIPTDLYYSDIAPLDYPQGNTHDWDANNNNVYGEFYRGSDGVNGMLDVMVGRAPVETTDEADIFVRKIILYEKYKKVDNLNNEVDLPDDFSVSILLGSQNFDYGNTLTDGDLDTSAEGKENIRQMFIQFDPNRWIFKRLYQDHLDVPATDQGADLSAASNADIKTAISDGANVVALSSHGSSGYFCYLTIDDLDDIESPFSIFYANACSTNKFDVIGGESISEWSILNPRGAAVGYIGNSRFGWTVDGYIELAFWEEMLVSGILGKMFRACQEVSHDWGKYSLNLLGDPSLRVWSNHPIEVNVSHRDIICNVASPIDFIVSLNNGPVPNAVVSLTQGGVYLCKGETNETGGVILNVAPLNLLNISVAVSGMNILPHFSTIGVRDCGVICRPIITCGREIICKKSIHCNKNLTCGMRIACGKSISCDQSIVCTKQIICASSITCENKILCMKDIGCRASILCKTSIGKPEFPPDICPQITPKEFHILDVIHEIWGVKDIVEYSLNATKLEIKEKLKKLPLEIQKPIKQMIEKIKNENRDKREK